jgi:LysR family transcriptional activator of dmlA
VTSPIQADDLAFFSALAGYGSLNVAARELGLSTVAISKHLAQMELRAGVAPVNRTTRRMSLTPGADIHAGCSPHQQLSARIRTFVDFLSASLAAPVPVKAHSRSGRAHAKVHARRSLSST